MTVDTEHFGYLLREARLKASLSIEEIARRTKIPVSQLERLESGDSSSLPADVFVCGFLRAYAREVGLDGEEAVARYRRVARNQPEMSYASLVISRGDDESDGTNASHDHAQRGGATARLDAMIESLVSTVTARAPFLQSAVGRRPAFALMVLLVVLVATLTLSLLLGGDPRPGRGLS
jgi:transcriptional regulator with XRE-family HTH domain